MIFTKYTPEQRRLQPFFAQKRQAREACFSVPSPHFRRHHPLRGEARLRRHTRRHTRRRGGGAPNAVSADSTSAAEAYPGPSGRAAALFITPLSRFHLTIRSGQVRLFTAAKNFGKKVFRAVPEI